MARSNYDYPNSHRAENLAAGYETAQEGFQGWRVSPGHNKNMLDGKQRVIGIAHVKVPDSKYSWYWPPTSAPRETLPPTPPTKRAKSSSVAGSPG